MRLLKARSQAALKAHEIVTDLEIFFVNRLDSLCYPSHRPAFLTVDWLRDKGLHGGGRRFVARDQSVFDRATVNVSQVHYEDEPARPLSSTTALSTIIHPMHPLAPSVHIHISYTELKNGQVFWRFMADLNPAVPCMTDVEIFDEALRTASGELYAKGCEEGLKYFFIPSLGRMRGASHFYIEGYSSGDGDADRAFAQRFGRIICDRYADILKIALKRTPQAPDYQAQLHYHTLYLLQVLTLDRGTVAGLLVHQDNDMGILGSLPSKIDRDLLESWITRHPEPQRLLIQKILSHLEGSPVALIGASQKRKLAEELRSFYRDNEAAKSLLARGERLPTTEENHSIMTS